MQITIKPNTIEIPVDISPTDIRRVGVALLQIQSQREEVEKKARIGTPQEKPYPLGGYDTDEAPPHQYTTGAVRSEQIKARYDLIPAGPLERLALRYGLGALKYGEYNWQKGMPFSDTFNHIEVHLANVKKKFETNIGFSYQDDDLAGAAWGCLALMFFETRGDYLARQMATNPVMMVGESPGREEDRPLRGIPPTEQQFLDTHNIAKQSGSGPAPVERRARRLEREQHGIQDAHVVPPDPRD